MENNELNTSEPFYTQRVEDNGLYDLVDAFAGEMKDRLADKFEDGKEGWDDEENAEYYYDRLMEKLEDMKGTLYLSDLVDVACFAAFLWNFDSFKEDE